MSIIKLTQDNFNTEVTNSTKPVLIDFYADWCGPCRMLSPTIEEIAHENAEIKVCKVDVDSQPELAQAFHVSSIPLLVVIKNGKTYKKSLGAIPKQKVLDLLK